MPGTFRSLIPPLISVILAFITGEVNVSLLSGILVGVLLFTNFNPADSAEVISEILSYKISENINIIVFLILLGMIVILLGKSGSAAAYGNLVSQKIKSKKHALSATAFLGALIFVDDYFNCLTAGTVMRPVTDRFNISREKLAYIIDSTAAPVCILIPLSSWASAVISSLPQESSGFSLFLKTVPFNFYAILSIITVAIVIVFDIDFPMMKKFETNALKKEIYNHEETKGKVFDLVIPIIFLILSSMLFMIITGGIFKNHSIVKSFQECNPSLSLIAGACMTLVIIFIMYIPRKIISVGEFFHSLNEGFNSMTSAILILVFAWILGEVCGENYMNIGGFIRSVISDKSQMNAFMPFLFFVGGAVLAFSTGTSWGTFGILIPIASSMFYGKNQDLFIMTVSATLSGAVCGDHISPISDTTILSSAGAGCSHINHVSSQFPYCLIAAFSSALGYLSFAVFKNAWLSLIISLSALIFLYIIIQKVINKLIYGNTK